MAVDYDHVHQGKRYIAMGRMYVRGDVHPNSCEQCQELKANFVRRDSLGVAVFGFDEMYRHYFGHDYEGDGVREASGPSMAMRVAAAMEARAK